MNEKIKKCKLCVGASFVGIPVRHDTTVPCKKEKAITLIALVITIIILLILAGVTLSIVLDNGLIGKSQTAVDTYSKEQAKERLTLLALQYKFGKLSGEEVTFEKIIEDAKGTATYNKTEKTYTVKLDGYEFEVDEESLEILGENGKVETPETPVTPEEPQEPEETDTPIITGGDNTEGTAHGTITGGEYAYNNPVIPAGFETVETELASWADVENDGIVDGWDNGLVIRDGSGNEFVWVPVDGTNVTYTKWTSTKNGSPTATNTSNDTTAIPVEDETDQIETYGGFYIARYEAGIPSDQNLASTSSRNEEGIPVSKKNQVPWNYIDYTTASANAKTMHTGTNVKSGLVTGTQWDTTMKWIENSTPTVDVQEDSTGWGNYRDAAVEEITEYSPYNSSATTGYNGIGNWTTVSSTTKPATGSSNADYMWLLKTGHTEYTNRKNIYDLAGNLWEWTAEIYSTDRVLRGGYFFNNVTSNPAAYR